MPLSPGLVVTAGPCCSLYFEVVWLYRPSPDRPPERPPAYSNKESNGACSL